MRPLVRNDVHLLLQASVELVGNVAAYKIPVDDSVMQINISVGMVSKGIISLKRPGGSLVQVGQPGVSITDTVGARVLTVSTPAMGEWTIGVSGTGTTLIAASASTPLYLHKFDFVTLTGRTEHVGYFPLEGNPISGKTQTMRASLFGVDNGLQFSFRRPNGSLIAPFSMVAGNLNAAAKQDFIGEVVPPSETFLIYVNGVTATGRPFQRVYPGQQSTSAVEVRLSSDPSAVPAGRQTRVAFSITNYGPANTFSFSALDTKGFLVGTAPAAIALGPDESKTVTISVLAPAGTPEGTQFSITLVATGTLAPTTNLAVVTLSVDITNRNPVCSAASANPSVIRIPNHKMVPVSVVGAASSTASVTISASNLSVPRLIVVRRFNGAKMNRRHMLTNLARVCASLVLLPFVNVARAFEKLVRPHDQWKKILPAASYAVLFEEGTERPGSSPLNAEKRKGTFVCAACNLPLFKSEQKYESGTGWPSFYDVMPGAVERKRDFKMLLPRTEYHCARCGGHQGHIFEDGPKPTGLRYCNNGVALSFVPSDQTLPELRA